ncbi:M15 family metallopeptidase [Fundidesulfovibrio terrae]|uniref:M15 family metallopeptidase n=1 Tax=Fundidesulfovibrio terrae TaxID=2922866 RepID=UPI001FAF8C12|nr:M15 family metallopeptidase [Fundidesulfovibrio terrae]
MRLKMLIALILLVLTPALAAREFGVLPRGFVSLREVAPEIVQDMRYHGWHNFLGRPVKGYDAPECILTIDTAKALKAVQDELSASGLGLKVYDCYRPKRAVEDFWVWSKNPDDQQAKAEFYPNVDKKDFFDLGYVAKKSGHSRGSTVDLTIVNLPYKEGEAFTPGQELVPCTASFDWRFKDGSLDMGTGFDCMDELSHSLSTAIPMVAQENRMLLRKIMEKHGFSPYEQEWWHFTLKKEPFPDTYFDFPVSSARQ